MQLVKYIERDNTLYINSDAITKRFPTLNEGLAYMRKPYAERIAESPYKAQIEAEIVKYEGCKLSEFCEGPSL